MPSGWRGLGLRPAGPAVRRASNGAESCSTGGVRASALVSLLAAAPVAAQSLQRLADPSPAVLREPQAARAFCARLGDWLYYPGFEAATGREIWRVHLTKGGNELYADLAPGRAGSDPHGLTAIPGALLFFASTPQTGFELWRIDAQGSAPVLVHDIRPGPASSRRPHRVLSRRLGAFGGRYYFAVHDPNTGSELWQTDGTPSGTTRVTLLGPGSPEGLLGFRASPFAAYFLLVDTGRAQLEVWTTDGTSVGTRVLHRFPLDPAGLRRPPYRLSVVSGSVLLVGPDGIWTLDGLNGLKQLPSAVGLSHDLIGSLPPRVPQSRPRFLFSGGAALWHSDCTVLGTYSIDPGAGLGVIQSRDQVGAEIGGRLLFFGFDLLHGEELWSTDGTRSGTVRLADLRVGPLDGQGHNGLGSLRRIVGNGTQAWFAAEDGSSGVELWTTEGTPHSTRRLTDLIPGVGSSYPRGLQVLADGSLVCIADDPQGCVLLRCEPRKPVQLLARNPALEDVVTAPSRIRGLHVLPRQLVFAAADQSTGSELWVSDGTSAGTRRLLDLRPGPASALAGPDPLQPQSHGEFSALRHGQTLWFSAWAGSGQFSLCRSDGTAAGTMAVRGLDLEQQRGWSLRGVSLPTGMLVEAYTAARGRGLYRLDPATGNLQWLATQQVEGLRRVEDRAYYWVRVAGQDELWTSDATSSNTRRVLRFPAVGGASPKLTAVAGRVFFIAPGTTPRLWVSDGTVAGSQALRSGKILELAALGPRLISIEEVAGFTVLRGGDGTVAGTSNIVHGLAAGARGLQEMGGRVLFSTGTGIALQLWATDGSTAGTQPVASLSGEGVSPRIDALGKLGRRRLLFSVLGSPLGRELWVTDGSAAGTRLVADLFPGAEGDTAREAVLLGKQVLFLGRDPAVGSVDADLWALRSGAVTHPSAAGCAAGLPPALEADDPVVGQPFNLRLQAGGQQTGVLMIGRPAANLLGLGHGCSLDADPVVNVTLAVQANAQGSWQLSAGTVPNLPSLRGLELRAQAACWPSAQLPLSADLSNSLVIVFAD